MYYNQARVSARMQELRKKSNYTQEKMAELMNVSLDHYRKALGSANIIVDSVYVMARRLPFGIWSRGDRLPVVPRPP